MVKTAIVKLSEVGTNCMLPVRFTGGDGRCHRWETCSYPEKKTCKAKEGEIAYRQAYLDKLEAQAEFQRKKIDELKRGEG